MPWEAWILVVLYMLNVVCLPLAVGKERKPITAGSASLLVAQSVILLVLVLRLGGVL